MAGAELVTEPLEALAQNVLSRNKRRRGSIGVVLRYRRGFGTFGIVCDAGVKCVNGKRLPGGVTAALAKAANQLPSAPETNAPPDAQPSGPPSGPPPSPGNVIDDDAEVVTE
jgi:hypothetical protein